MHDIVVVDDEKDIRELLSDILTDEGYEVRTAADSDSFFSLLKVRLPSIIILDIWLKKSTLDGMEILYKVKENYPNIPVIMISGHGTIDCAVRAMQAGAFNFLEKPIKLNHLLLLVERALETRKLLEENEKANEFYKKDAIELLGTSSAIVQINQQLNKYADTNSRILIIGEDGTGKSVLARKIHQLSTRSQGNFIIVNCKNKSETDLEKEIFGVGDMVDNSLPLKAGALEQAHKGTLFLDGIEYLPKTIQQKLTKFFVEKHFARSHHHDKTVFSDVRVLGSIHIKPDSAIEKGILTSDFFERLAVVRLSMPSLRERREDIKLLISEITKDIVKLHNFAMPLYNEDALISLQIFDWAGNIKQLRNIIENCVIKAQADIAKPIDANDLPHEIKDDISISSTSSHNVVNYMNLPLREAREQFEKEYLMMQLSVFKGNISRTAQFVGMERSALHRKLRSLGVSAKENSIESV